MKWSEMTHLDITILLLIFLFGMFVGSSLKTNTKGGDENYGQIYVDRHRCRAMEAI